VLTTGYSRTRLCITFSLKSFILSVQSYDRHDIMKNLQRAAMRTNAPRGRMSEGVDKRVSHAVWQQVPRQRTKEKTRRAHGPVA